MEPLNDIFIVPIGKGVENRLAQYLRHLDERLIELWLIQN